MNIGEYCYKQNIVLHESVSAINILSTLIHQYSWTISAIKCIAEFMKGREQHFEMLMTPTKSKKETVYGFCIEH